MKKLKFFYVDGSTYTVKGVDDVAPNSNSFGYSLLLRTTDYGFGGEHHWVDTSKLLCVISWENLNKGYTIFKYVESVVFDGKRVFIVSQDDINYIGEL